MRCVRLLYNRCSVYKAAVSATSSSAPLRTVIHATKVTVRNCQIHDAKVCAISPKEALGSWLRCEDDVLVFAGCLCAKLRSLQSGAQKQEREGRTF